MRLQEIFRTWVRQLALIARMLQSTPLMCCRMAEAGPQTGRAEGEYDWSLVVSWGASSLWLKGRKGSTRLIPRTTLPHGHEST